MTRRYDIAIVGSGFSGSILARIFANRGRRVLLVDAAHHPRFAIGESSTPIADLLLRRLGQRYGLPDLIDLSSYGSWQAAMPELPCGIKRGFSYFDHRPSHGEAQEHSIGQRSLLVAASPNEQASDTHWYRPAVDEFLFHAASRAGVDCRQGISLTGLFPSSDGGFRLETDSGWSVSARRVIDASGAAAVTAQALGNTNLTNRLQTRTATAFAHFRGVEPFSALINNRYGDQRGTTPFDADDAAQHHLVDEGWLWMLRMNNGITSVGMTGPDEKLVRAVLRGRAETYPHLHAILQNAHPVAPQVGAADHGIASLHRVQRLIDPWVGANCVLLPTTAFTLDPLHSTGIAHALAGVERLTTWLLGETNDDALQQYRRTLLAEAAHLDRLVAMAYAAMASFDRFVAACMVYFAAAISCEERLIAGDSPRSLWLVDDEHFCQAVRECDKLIRHADERSVCDRIRRLIEPWNSAGLMDDTQQNRYVYTATK